MKITDNVIKLDCTKGAYAYAVLSDGVTLIDTGLPGGADKIFAELKQSGISPSDIKRILLTHCDSDHIGSVLEIHQRTSCEIFIGREDLDYALRRKRPSGIKWLASVIMPAKCPDSTQCLEKGAEYDGIQVLETRGHTRGHSCFRFKNVLFAGDLIRVASGAIVLSPKRATWDSELNLRSCRSIKMDGIDWICPAHGEPVPATPAWTDFRNKYL